MPEQPPREKTCTIDWVVGLGNPGKRYRETRHNIGFMVVDELARRSGTRLRSRFVWKAECGKVPREGLLLVKPLTFMNRSGLTVRRLCAWGGRGLGGLLVVVDDLALPFGAVRLRARGSAGGHNGLRSIIEATGSEGFARLRVGIGTCPPGMSVVDHVLSSFPDEERGTIEEVVGKAADAVEYAVGHGVEKAMNEIN